MSNGKTICVARNTRGDATWVECNGDVMTPYDICNLLAEQQRTIAALREEAGNAVEYIDHLENSLERLDVSNAVFEDMPHTELDWERLVELTSESNNESIQVETPTNS